MNGLYGKASPLAGAITKLTNAVPADKVRTVNVGVVNTTDLPATIHIAYSSSADDGSGIAASDWKVSGRQLAAHAEYERTGQVLAEGEKVFVKSDIDGVAFDVRGFEGSE